MSATYERDQGLNNPMQYISHAYATGILSKQFLHRGCMQANVTRSARISFSSPHTQHVVMADPFSGAAKHCLGSPTISLHIGHSFFASDLAVPILRFGERSCLEYDKGPCVVINITLCLPSVLSSLGHSCEIIEFINARSKSTSAVGAALPRNAMFTSIAARKSLALLCVLVSSPLYRFLKN